MGKPVTFSIVGGGGFRAQYFLRIAQALQDRFRVSGMVVRNEDKGREMERRWRVNTYRSLAQLLDQERPDFVLLSVPPAAAFDYIVQLGERGVPILMETPPAPGLGGLLRLNELVEDLNIRLQIAEQYPLHPVQVARKTMIRSGMLGRVDQVTVSISHYYHAVSLMRSMLGLTFEDATIRAMRFESEWVAGPTRSGPPTEDRLVPSERVLAWLDFGGKLGIYDFTKDQHRSWTRSNHLSVRGTRGEIFDNRVIVQDSSCKQIRMDLHRVNKGEYENAEGYFLQGILAGGQWVYENPFLPARLYDDELAIASCLERMAAYAAGGPSFYSLAEASQDQYLGLLIEEAARTGEPVRSVRQPWAGSSA